VGITPPRTALRLLTWCVDRDAAEAIAGDLTEGFAERATRNRAGAWLWFWQQTIASILSSRRSTSQPSVGIRTMRTVTHGLPRDVAQAGRHLQRHPITSATIIITIATCVAFSAAAFTVIAHVLWAPLPWPEPDRVVRLYNSYPRIDMPRAGTSVPEWLDRRERATTLVDLVLYRQESNTVGTSEGNRHTFALRVTPSFFPLVGVVPDHGRVFTDADRGSQPVVIGHALWTSAFGGRTDIINSRIDLDGTRFTVVGILPASFRFPTWDAQVYTPLFFDGGSADARRRHTDEFDMVGRLAPGASVEMAEQEVNRINAAMLETYPAELHTMIASSGYTTIVRPMLDDLIRDIKEPLTLLWAGALLVVAIGIGNVVSLLLLRARTRAPEVRLRLTLGASRSRLARQFFVESSLLAAIGGLLGITGTHAALRLLEVFEVYEIPRVGDVVVDTQTWAWSLLVVTVVALIGGLIPAIATLRRADHLGAGGSRTATAIVSWPQRLLVSGQIAFAMTLVVLATLLASSLRHLMAVDPGFTPDQVSVAALILPGSRYSSASSRVDAMTRIVDAIETLPHVRRAAFASQLPFSGEDGRAALFPEHGNASPGETLSVPYNSIVSAGYFDAMGIHVVEGRGLLPSDTLRGPRVAVIDLDLARRYWPDGALNERFWFGSKRGPDSDAVTVVGVVNPIRQNSLRERDGVGAIYQPTTQNPPGFVRLAVAFQAQAPWTTVVDRIRSVDPGLVPFWTDTLSNSVDTSLLVQRGPMRLLGGFAAVGVFLGVLGVYGVIAHEFGQRRRELAIRVAIGGRRPDILRLLGRRWLTIVGGGSVVGLAGAVATHRLIDSLLYGTGPSDPTVLGFSVTVLAAAAALACLGPVRRALSVDPILVLRGD
jgi:predicted permease